MICCEQRIGAISMGNSQKEFNTNSTSRPSEKMFTPVNEFKFHDLFDEESTNGLFLSNMYLPEEVIVNILSYVPAEDILSLSLVCKKWCNIIKSDGMWMDIYNRQHSRKARNLPWYVYYNYFATDNFTNLVKNGNGQDRFKHWKIVKNFGDEFRIEDPPVGADPLPPHVPDFDGHTGCFVTSYYECYKVQEIPLKPKRLLMYIINKFKPHIYASEWMAGRFDCGCKYRLEIRGYSENSDEEFNLETNYDADQDAHTAAGLGAPREVEIVQWQGKEWKKVEIVIEEYPIDVVTLFFEHEGRDTQFWKGHYGSKMAGGVLRFDLDSIDPLKIQE